MSDKLNLIGHKFNRLIVISEAPSNKRGRSVWLCRCDCGQSKFILGNSLMMNLVKSCGCLNNEKRAERFFIHGMSGTKEHKSWKNMIQRCTNPKNKHWKDYGERGIKVCDRWLESFSNFYKDMGNKPKGLTLERINNNGNYCKENCKWATIKENVNNRRCSVKNRMPICLQ